MSNVSSLNSSYEPSVAPNNPKSQLRSEDFINLLITQLKNQDPLQPMKNNELLAQVSQIGTLQSQTSLQTSLQSMVLQNQVSSASGMIGRSVAGLDGTGSKLTGLVTSVRVRDKKVVLELDTGKSLPLDRVTDVGPAPASVNATTGGGVLGGTGGTAGGSGATVPSADGLTGPVVTSVLTPKTSGGGSINGDR